MIPIVHCTSGCLQGHQEILKGFLTQRNNDALPSHGLVKPLGVRREGDLV